MFHLINKKGFTLIEMIIVVSISVVIIAIIAQAYIASTRVFQQETGRADIWLEGNHSLGVMSKEIMKSRKIISAGNQSLSLWLEDLNLDNTSEANEIISYSLQQGNLMRTSSVDTTILSGHVTNLNFSYDQPLNPSLITIDLTLSDGQLLNTFEVKAKLRNF